MTSSVGLVATVYRYLTWYHIIAVVSVAYLIQYIWIVAKARVTLPPGPLPYPVVGNPLGKIAHLSLTNLAKKYGDIMTVFMGSRPIVVISGTSRIRECLLKHSSAFAGNSSLYCCLNGRCTNIYLATINLKC